MIIYRQAGLTDMHLYGSIPMHFDCESVYAIKRINNGLGGILFEETPVEPYLRELDFYDPPETWRRFDTSHWAFYMAYDGELPVGGAAVASKTKEVDLLCGRDDITLLWDIRVDDRYKRQGVGAELFDLAVRWSRDKGFRQMKIETQNNNVAACRFYHKQGAYLCAFDEYSSYTDLTSKEHEFGMMWYLDL